ncbi:MULTISPECIES: hypothetical protein [Comamonas]|uniref:hypothetical protein n=1 Tax=Comamonas TaxID=283 RepID=UPI00257AA2B2|nr:MULTISPECIES: hypothetical protein [Comamonas]
MSGEKKTSGKTVPVFDSAALTSERFKNESFGSGVNRPSTIGDPQVRGQDGFVTRNAAPPPVSDIPARPKGK